MAAEATWDHEVDVLVAGSGAAGMTAALAAHAHGCSTLLIEKTKYYGGTTAFSGGGMWIPNNPVLRREGMRDTPDDARRYLDALLELNNDRVSPERRTAFLTEGPKAVEFLEQQCDQLRFFWVRGYPDYHPELPGASEAGRQIQPCAVDGRVLGPEHAHMRRARLLVPQPFGMWIMISEARDLSHIGHSWRARTLAARLALRGLVARLQGRRIEPYGGLMLVAGLRAGLLAHGVPLWLQSPLTALITSGGDHAVTGARVEREGSTMTIRARAGVILAAGGFEHNEEMRRRYQREPVNRCWSLGASGNTGDAIRAGAAVGADLGLMDDAWWAPGILTPEGRSVFLLTERQQPGSIMVDAAGDRYTNESAPYVNVGHAMYRAGDDGPARVPSWFVVDTRFRNRYKLGPFLPRQRIPQAWLDSGVAVRAESIPALAAKMGIEPGRLQATIGRFNRFAGLGVDADFGRGESAYDRYYADPKQKPNPCLGPIDRAPFFAFQTVPGDIGTKGGLLTNEHAQALGADGGPIPGLYGAGNAAAAVMGHEYAGPGATIGPAVVFGYIAGKHAALATGRSAR